MSAPLSELRIAPHSIDAECAVLGGLMLSPESLPKVSDWLTESDFYRKDHRLVFRAVVTLIARGSPVDPVTMADWFESAGLSEHVGLTYLINLADSTPSAANIVAYGEIVAEKSRLRAAIEAGVMLMEAAWAKGADSQQVLATAAHELSQMQVSKLRGGLESVKVGMRKMQTELMARYQQGQQLLGQPWPYKELNERTKGLRDSLVYIVAARPSMGKSVMGLQVAVNNALAGNHTALFSVEMSDEECMFRAVSCVGEVPHDWVESPNDSDPDADMWWPRTTEAMQRITDAPLLIDATPAISIVQLMARARRVHLQKPLRLIVVDHMHDMKIDPKLARFEYGEIVQGGKTLAKEFKCPVIILAQLNRNLAARADKKPTLTDLREAGEIEQKADVVLLLHRDDYYDSESEMKGVVEVIMAKGRNIRTGEPVLLQNNFAMMRMDDWVGPRPVKSQSTFKPKSKRGFPG